MKNIYIIGGHAVVRTPEGEKNLKEGDAIAFPASPEGARVIRNESATVCPSSGVHHFRESCLHPCSGAFPRFFRRRGLPSCGPRPSGEKPFASVSSPVGYNVVGAIYS